MRKSRWLILLISIILAGALTACNNEQTSEEANAAQAYLQAVLRNDDAALDERICANVPAGTGSQELLSLWSIGLALEAAGPEYAIEDLQVDVVAAKLDGNENEAQVRMRGSVTIPADLLPGEQLPLPVDDEVTLDEVWRMVNEDGTWKWCGGVIE